MSDLVAYYGWQPIELQPVRQQPSDIFEYRARVDKGLPLFGDGGPDYEEQPRRGRPRKNEGGQDAWRGTRRMELAKRIVEYVTEHGPTKSRDLSRILEADRVLIGVATARCRELIVERRRQCGKREMFVRLKNS